MHGSARICAVAFLIALLAGLALPGAAFADGGCGTAGRPACTVLRATAPEAAGPIGLGAPDCVVHIGGLGSTADSTERAFNGLTTEGAETSVLEYDSLGRIAAAGEALRAHVARISDRCGAIHLVAHSLGGVVADRAFSKGLSGADRVVTYIPLASPHNGSAMARDLCGIADVEPDYADLLRQVAELLDVPDPTAEAICDLARVRPPRPARGVQTARLRLVTDPLVLRRDHVGQYFDIRELLPQGDAEIEGHGGILRSPQAREIVQRSIEQGSIASDDRGPDERIAAEVASHAAERVASTAHAAVADLVWAGAALSRLARVAREILEKVRESVAFAGPYLLDYASQLPTLGSARFDR